MIDKENKQPKEGNEEEANFEEMLAASFKSTPQINIGDKVEAVIVNIDRDNIFLEMGTRAEGFVNKAEFVEDGKLTVKEGQNLEVYVVGKSQGIFKCKRYLGAADSDSTEIKDESIYNALRDAFENSQPVEGKVKEVKKSGFEVAVMGQKAFCPISQVDKVYCDNPEKHVNKLYTFKIIEFAEDGNNIVLSRKEILLEEDERKAEKLWQELEVGKIYEGTVTAVKKYGAFIDIGGIDGLLHVSEISFGRVDDVQDLIKVGQTLKVKAINIDRSKRRIGFSLKTQLEDPWSKGLKQLKVGDEIKGKVVRMKPYGAFIEILPGLDGLLHVSRLGTGKRHDHPKEVMRTGDVVTVWVAEINENKKTISLTMEEPEIDFSKDLKNLKKEQEKQEKDQGGQLSDLLDSPEEKKEE